METLTSCVAMAALLLLKFLIGGLAVNYLLGVFSLTAPFLICGLIGSFTAKYTTPIAIVVWLLHFITVA